METAFHQNPFARAHVDASLTPPKVTERIFGKGAEEAVRDLLDEEREESAMTDELSEPAFDLNPQEAREAALRILQQKWIKKSEELIAERTEEDTEYPGMLAMQAIIHSATTGGMKAAREVLKQAKDLLAGRSRQPENWELVIEAEIRLGEDPTQNGSISELMNELTVKYAHDPKLANKQIAVHLARIAVLFPAGSTPYRLSMNTAKDAASRLLPGSGDWIGALVDASALQAPDTDQRAIESLKERAGRYASDIDKRTVWSAVAEAEMSHGIDPTETCRLIEENARATRARFSEGIFRHGLADLTLLKRKAGHDVRALITELKTLPDPGWDNPEEVRTYYQTLATIAVLEARTGIDPTEAIDKALTCQTSRFNTLTTPEIMRSIFEYLRFLNQTHAAPDRPRAGE